MLHKRQTILILILFLSLVRTSPLFVSSAQASVQLGPGEVYYSLSNNTYISWNGTLYASSVNYYGDHVSFNQASFNATDSPNLSFAIGVENGNVTIDSIGASSEVGLLRVNTTSVSGRTLLLNVSNSVTGEPIEVNITQGSTQTIVKPPQYITNYASFLASSNAVYWNDSRQYAMVSDTSSTITVEFNATLPAQSGPGGTSSGSQSGQISAPFVKVSPLSISSAGGTFQANLEIINNESSVQASLTSLSFSSQIASVSYDQNSLPLAIAAGQTKDFPVSVTVPANTTAGTYQIDGAAQFSEASVSVSSGYTVNFVIQITVSGATQSFNFLQWLRSHYQWIAVIVTAMIMISLVAYSRRDD